MDDHEPVAAPAVCDSPLAVAVVARALAASAYVALVQQHVPVAGVAVLVDVVEQASVVLPVAELLHAGVVRLAVAPFCAVDQHVLPAVAGIPAAYAPQRAAAVPAAHESLPVDAVPARAVARPASVVVAQRVVVPVAADPAADGPRPFAAAARPSRDSFLLGETADLPVSASGSADHDPVGYRVDTAMHTLEQLPLEANSERAQSQAF